MITIFYRPMLLVILLLGATLLAHAQSNSSLYTDLDANKCRTIKSTSDEGGSYEGKCRGVAGYSLVVVEGDLRQNVEVVTPKSKKHSLELWGVISSGFSSVGPKAEWRMSKVKGRSKPIALIIRYNASENSEDASKITSYLAVSKITDTEVCVVEKIGPAANANDLARKAADTAASKPCLKP